MCFYTTRRERGMGEKYKYMNLKGETRSQECLKSESIQLKMQRILFFSKNSVLMSFFIPHDVRGA